MKLVKLSLVTALAAGAFATTSFAKPLEEMIKDVDVSGFVLARYDVEKETDKDRDSTWRFKSDLTLKNTIDDNFFAVVGLRFDSKDESAKQGGYSNGKNHNLEIFNAYLGYMAGNTSISVGRQTVGAFFTDDLYGDGIKVVNTDAQGLTLAALYMDNLNSDTNIGSAKIFEEEDNTHKVYKYHLLNDGKATYQHSLWGAAIIGSYEPVGFQLWYAGLNKVADLFAAELGFDVGVDVDSSVNFKIQYAHTNFKKDFKKNAKFVYKTENVQGDPLQLAAANSDLKLANTNFMGVEVGTNLSGFDLSLGYATYGKKGKVGLSSFEDQGQFITLGEDLLDYSLYTGKHNVWMASLGYKVPDTGVNFALEYVNEKVKGPDAKNWEAVARLGYKYNNKINFSTFWSHTNEKAGDDKAEKNNHFRFQAKYSF